VARDAYDPVFNQRTGGPRVTAYRFEPMMRRFVPNVVGVKQGEHHIDVEQVGCHGDSSRRRFTSSSVTSEAPRRKGNSGTPFRVCDDLFRRIPLRANSERIFPAEVPCCRASSLAARRTSSSMSRVVRMPVIIKHQTSDVKLIRSGIFSPGRRRNIVSPRQIVGAGRFIERPY
jgi:hypothetical protein